MNVITTERLPIKVWQLSAEDGPDDQVMAQLKNLANLPIAERWVCAMPDFHVGYGMPIGGVLATRGGVIPYAVGVDIGCGMIAAQTSLDADIFTFEEYQELRLAIHARVPVGHVHHKADQPMPRRLHALRPDIESSVVGSQYKRAARQIGTMGGGNHFLELQKDTEGRLWIMLHSGSRNVGKQVCDHYHKVAKRYMRDFASAVPDPDLSFLPDSVPEYASYLAEMEWCMAFAEESRKVMLDQALEALVIAVGHPVNVDMLVDTHHNFAAMENHYGQNYLVHRKGAVKAQGYVTIPGSMGTASYICRGLEPEESFNTCSHGAGRVMGRNVANKMMEDRHEEAVRMMAHVAFNVRPGDYDELGHCYKDIDAVVAAQADLVEPYMRLTPLAVVKG